MLLQALSLGREVDVWRPRTGVIHSVFQRAVNLMVAGDLWTVLAAARPDAPFGIRLACDDGGLKVGATDLVHVRAGFVGLGKMVIDCRCATRWAPGPWAPPAIGLAARLSVLEEAARRRAWRGSSEMADKVLEALSGSDADLAHAVRRVVGRGPGLTPAGDDVLVGILTLLTSGAAGPAGVLARTRLAQALRTELHATTDVSRQLLRQAERGLPGRALHDLGQALIEGAPDDILLAALVPVLNTGSTSGADSCMGLAAACRFFFLRSKNSTHEH